MPNPEGPADRRNVAADIGPGRLVAITICLLAPFVALLWVSSYAKETPKLFGFPFFYWYQLLWVFIAAGLTYLAMRLIPERKRPLSFHRGDSDGAGADLRKGGNR
ncbi:MAG: DUF3311 domain-containing protein [Motilibacteraceae bacterium]